MSVCIDISLSLSLSFFFFFFFGMASLPSFKHGVIRHHSWRSPLTFLRVFFFFFFSPLNLYSIGISPSIYTFYTCDVCDRARKRVCPGIAHSRLARAHAHRISFARFECESFEILSFSLSLSLFRSLTLTLACFHSFFFPSFLNS